MGKRQYKQKGLIMGKVIEINKFLKKPEKSHKEIRLEKISESLKRIDLLFQDLSKLSQDDKKIEGGK